MPQRLEWAVELLDVRPVRATWPAGVSGPPAPGEG